MKTEYPFYEIESEIHTVKDIIDGILHVYSDNPVFCFRQGKEVINKYKQEFADDVRQVECILHEKFQTGSNIALLGKTSYEWLVCYFAIMNSENIAIPLDKELPKDDLRELIEFSDAECLIYDSNCLDVVQFMESYSQHKMKYICMQTIEDRECLGDIVRSTNTGKEWTGNPQKEDIAEIIYTSGTTGKAKGCMITHSNLAWNAMNCTSFVNLQQHDRVLSVLPIHHALELAAGIMTPLCCGVTICINDSLKHLAPNMLFFKPTGMVVVPLVIQTFYKNIWREISKKKKTRRIKLAMNFAWCLYKFGIDVRRKIFAQIINTFGGNLRILVVGGAYMEPKIIRDFQKWGITIIQGYGITECAPVISCNADRLIKYDSVGKVVTGASVKIVNDEIWVKGPMVMKGYYKNQQATKEVLDEGWFKTGDLGRIDDNHYLYISGRKKNLIILANGENVSPEYLEQQLLKITYIKEVLVSEKDGKIQAEVVLDEEIEEARERVFRDVEKLNRTLPDYMKIADVVIRKEEFEKTTTRKIKRKTNE